MAKGDRTQRPKKTCNVEDSSCVRSLGPINRRDMHGKAPMYINFSVLRSSSDRSLGHGSVEAHWNDGFLICSASFQASLLHGTRVGASVAALRAAVLPIHTVQALRGGHHGDDGEHHYDGPLQRTLAIIKPDAVAAGNEENIKHAILEDGFKIVAEKRMQLTKKQVCVHVPIAPQSTPYSKHTARNERISASLYHRLHSQHSPGLLSRIFGHARKKAVRIMTK